MKQTTDAEFFEAMREDIEEVRRNIHLAMREERAKGRPGRARGLHRMGLVLRRLRRERQEKERA